MIKINYTLLRNLLIGIFVLLLIIISAIAVKQLQQVAFLYKNEIYSYNKIQFILSNLAIRFSDIDLDFHKSNNNLPMLQSDIKDNLRQISELFADYTKLANEEETLKKDVKLTRNFSILKSSQQKIKTAFYAYIDNYPKFEKTTEHSLVPLMVLTKVISQSTTIAVASLAISLDRSHKIINDNIVRISATTKTIIWVIVFLTILALIFIIILHYIVKKPINELLKISEAISQGKFDNAITSAGEDDFGRLSKSLSNMQVRLKKLIFDLEIEVKKRKEAEEKNYYLAMHDKLTGLTNRAFFEHIFDRELEKLKRQPGSMCLFSMDLDRFKSVNDTLGHDVGDRLLVEVAKKFLFLIRKEDIVARIGGDEFSILFTDIHDKTEATNAAKKLIDAIDEPFVILGHEIQIGLSIGIVFYPDHGLTREDLTKHADLALYEAKNCGKNCFHFYASSYKC